METVTIWMYRKTLLFILLFVIAGSVHAKEWEYYTEVKAKIPLSRTDKLYLNIKEETRHKNGVNIYRKSFFGISKRLRPDLEIAFYYAFKEKKKDDWRKLHMLWTQLNFKVNLWGESDLALDTKMESHVTQKMWRLRQKFKLIYPLCKINFWIGDEVRLFSLFEDPYFGENEALGGFDVKFNKIFLFSIYYDLRSIKNQTRWQDTNCLRAVFDFKF